MFRGKIVYFIIPQSDAFELSFVSIIKRHKTKEDAAEVRNILKDLKKQFKTDKLYTDHKIIKDLAVPEPNSVLYVSDRFIIGKFTTLDEIVDKIKDMISSYILHVEVVLFADSSKELVVPKHFCNLLTGHIYKFRILFTTDQPNDISNKHMHFIVSSVVINIKKNKKSKKPIINDKLFYVRFTMNRFNKSLSKIIAENYKEDVSFNATLDKRIREHARQVELFQGILMGIDLPATLRTSQLDTYEEIVRKVARSLDFRKRYVIGLFNTLDDAVREIAKACDNIKPKTADIDMGLNSEDPLVLSKQSCELLKQHNLSLEVAFLYYGDDTK